MSSTSAPFGLRPAFSPMGIPRPWSGQIKSGYAANIFQYQPIRSGLSSDSGAVEGYIVPSAAGEAMLGTFMGVEYVDSTGRQRVSNTWVSGTTGTNIIAYYTMDPTIVYEIQGNASLSIANIGNQYNTTAASGNTTTGFCTMQLDVSSGTTNAQMRVIGLSAYVDNAWGDAYTIVQVQIAKHQNVATIAAY